MIKRSFYFIRHGQTDWNAQLRLQGRTDTTLNENGREQAKSSIIYIKGLGIKRMVSSPQKRALETAQIINQTLCVPLETHPDLMERSFGIFEGMTTPEIEDMKKEHALLDNKLEPTGYACPPKAETHDELVERSINAVNEVLDESDDTVLFVSHGGVFAALVHALVNDGIYRHSDNSVPYFFEYRQNQPWRVINLKDGRETYRNVQTG